MTLDTIPPALVPVIAAVVASVIGALLWRLFKLALRLVLLVIVVIIGAGVVAKKPELIGLARDALFKSSPVPLPAPGAPHGP